MPARRVHFRAGFAEADITPDPGRRRVELSGYVARVQPAAGVRDRLKAAVLAIAAAGEEPRALVGLDLCILGAAAATRIASACPLPADRIVLACSHTHAAPATYPLIGCGDPDPVYERWLSLRVGDAMRRAVAGMVSCRLGWGRRRLSEPRWGNRRDPGGATDPRLHLLKIERSESARTPICAVWSAACHPVVLGAENRLVSADWVGQVRQALPWPSLFLQGFCGDQNPLCRGMSELGAWSGLAGEVADLWSVTPTASAGPCGWRRRVVELPRLPGDAVVGLPADGSRAAAAMQRWATGVARPGEGVPPMPAAVAAWRVHNGSAVFWPGEPHIPHALALPAGCLGVGHIGASVGYVPDRAAYAWPGYEAGSAHRYYGFPSALAPEAGEALLAACMEMLAELG